MIIEGGNLLIIPKAAPPVNMEYHNDAIKPADPEGKIMKDTRLPNVAGAGKLHPLTYSLEPIAGGPKFLLDMEYPTNRHNGVLLRILEKAIVKDDYIGSTLVVGVIKATTICLTVCA